MTLPYRPSTASNSTENLIKPMYIDHLQSHHWSHPRAEKSPLFGPGRRLIVRHRQPRRRWRQLRAMAILIGLVSLSACAAAKQAGQPGPETKEQGDAQAVTQPTVKPQEPASADLRQPKQTFEGHL